MSHNKTLIYIIPLLFSCITLSGQEWADTLIAAKKTADKIIRQSADRPIADLYEIRGTLSPLGEGDPIRWAQSLPGVTTGADGSSAYYVRGGNMGNNLITLDGVPIYGFSHLLGLTTIIPTSIIESSELAKGGFDGRENNFTASHLNITSKSPSSNICSSVSVNTFLLSADCEGAIAKKLYFLFSVRYSPLSWEYKVFRKLLPEKLGNLNEVKTDIGDLYGKIRYSFSSQTYLDLSALGSIDSYSFSNSANSNNQLQWKNGIASLRFLNNGLHARNEIMAYVSYFDTQQIQNTIYRGVPNNLTLRSELLELGLSADRNRKYNLILLAYGGKFRYALFSPGQVASVNTNTYSTSASLYLQPTLSLPKILDFKTVFRLSYFNNHSCSAPQFIPEISATAKVPLGNTWAIEASFDRISQYYHCLEGLPIGWSLDMIVPSGDKVLPEIVSQGYLGTSYSGGNHSFSLGAFYKSMDNLVYYKYAQSLFSGGMAEWESQVSQGKGKSMGIELQYSMRFDDWGAKINYTLSKTNRYGFADINDGEEFHARFDRTHIFQLHANWKNLSMSTILQSGHWENGAAQTYPMHTLGNKAWRADYYSGVNNYHMPYVFRLDVGYNIEIAAKRINHSINIGICNLSNHFNPFMLYFDAEKEIWKEMALLPFMPNFSYRISF